jgi:hypothetical protein
MAKSQRPQALRQFNETSTESKTLATQIRLWREKRMMTPDLLALKALVPLRLVEDIEAGIELFLAPAIRQRLARVLHVRPTQIQELEKPPASPEATREAKQLQQAGSSLYQTILANPEAAHSCPACGAVLSIRIFERRDLQNRPLTVVKASCTACLFRLTDD